MLRRTHRAGEKFPEITAGRNLDLLRRLLIKLSLEWGKRGLAELGPQAINVPFGDSIFTFLEGLDLLP